MVSCPLTDEYVHTRERNTLVLTQATTGRKLENIMLTENCLLPKGLSPKSQNPRKAEKRMVIATGSVGRGTGAVTQRFYLGRGKVLAMDGGEWPFKVHTHVIPLNYIR